MPIKKGYILKQIGTNYIILSNDNHSFSYKIDQSGAEIFQGLEQGYRPEDIAYRLAKQFRIREDILLRDVNEFIDELKERGIFE